MNKKLIVVICILVVIFIIISIMCIIKSIKKVEISSIKSFKYFYSNGYAINANTEYTLEYKDNNYIVTIKPNGVPEEDKKEFEVDKEFASKIEEIFKKYDVGYWNGFDKIDSRVLDGDSFSFSVTFENEDEIYASGYMVWPKNYREVKEELNNLFNKLYEM